MWREIMWFDWILFCIFIFLYFSWVDDVMLSIDLTTLWIIGTFVLLPHMSVTRSKLMGEYMWIWRFVINVLFSFTIRRIAWTPSYIQLVRSNIYCKIKFCSWPWDQDKHDCIIQKHSTEISHIHPMFLTIIYDIK